MLAAAVWLAVAAGAAEHPGRAVFDAAGCRSCHRVGERGGNAGPDLTLVGLRRSREWLELWLADPKGWKKDARMPDLRLRPRERAAAADYLATLKGGDWRRRPWEGRPDAGRVIYERAGCVACHGVRGRGGHPNNNVPGQAIPSLAKAFEGFTLEELQEKIRRGSRPEPERPEGLRPLAHMPAWGEVLGDGEIEAVARYVASLGEGGGDW